MMKLVIFTIEYIAEKQTKENISKIKDDANLKPLCNIYGSLIIISFHSYKNQRESNSFRKKNSGNQSHHLSWYASSC